MTAPSQRPLRRVWRFAITVIVVVIMIASIAGYNLGKDMALRDNAGEDLARGQAD